MQSNETETTEPAESKPGRASYSPEDNKLRLYVGRVPRDEFLKLRAEGWRTLHKQREAGGGDFVATWSPSRVRTCLKYADIIEDEDMGPEERAADRAERFGGYRDKRTTEATGHADRYDSGPSVHGYQSQARAERSAARHDRIADRAGDAWSKAEYWTRRTEGVIRHALYKSSPGVRMGRIKTIEAELRKERAEIKERKARWAAWSELRAIADPEKQTKAALFYTGHSSGGWYTYRHPRAADLPESEKYLKENDTSLYSLLSHERFPITGAEAVAMWFECHGEPSEDNEWTRHCELRLAYENQMLAAQGGMLEQFEVLPGGKLGNRLIIKVSKSSVTKRATSCDILGPKVQGWTYRAANIPGTEFAAYKFDLERIKPDTYTPPTPESLAELKAFNDSRKANVPKKAPCPLVNPTNEDADRLQALWNERAKADHEAANTYRSAEARAMHSAQFKPATVCRIPQAVYSENAKGAYSRAFTRTLHRDGFKGLNPEYNMHSEGRSKYSEKIGKALCQIRLTREGEGSHHTPHRVIVLTDKPQKPLPAAVWEKHEAPAAVVEPETVNA
jgi:hypothetical protein